MKKIILSIFAIVLLLGVSGCGAEKNIEGSLESIMEKVYVDIPEDERPMALSNIELTSETIENFIGTSDIAFTEALASESAVGSIAHSVVLLRVDSKTNVDEAKKKIEENVNPRKWICVEAEETKVLSKGNLIILIMSSSENASKLENSFNNLK